MVINFRYLFINSVELRVGQLKCKYAYFKNRNIYTASIQPTMNLKCIEQQ